MVSKLSAHGCPNRHRPGTHVWTDWSKIDLDKAQLAGAGIIILPPRDDAGDASPPRSCTTYYEVGGTVTPTRVELVAMTSARQDAYTDTMRTIYTDCMAVINMNENEAKSNRDPSWNLKKNPTPTS
eukprot:3277894-Rhodomonas_salina.1